MAKKTGNKRKRKKKIRVTGKILGAVIALVLIIAIIMATLYFVRRDIFDIIVDTITGDSESGGGKVPQVDGDTLTVHFIDVGQGDCIFITFPDGKSMMIDAGGSSDTHGTKPKDKILNYVKELGVTAIDSVMVTHSDSDHTAYMDDVIENFEVRNIYLPLYIGATDGSDKSKPGHIPTKTYGDVVNAANAETYTDGDELKRAEIKYNVDTVTNYDGKYKLVSYCKSAEYYGTVKASNAKMLNSVSPISVLEYGGRKVVFTGDAEGSGANDVESEFISRVRDIDCDVLKVGHHGSAAGTTEGFLKHIDPEYAVISAGIDNRHGHPTQTTLDKLSAYEDLIKDSDAVGIQRVFRTDKDGNVVLTIGSNGGYTIVAEYDENENVTSVMIFSREYALVSDKERYAA